MPGRKGARTAGARAPGSWTVEEVVELATRHNLAELEVESGGTRIRVVREQAPLVPGLGGRSAHPDLERHPPAGNLPAPTNHVTVEAPMVGTFYRAPAPDAAPFVNEGDLIKEDQVLCIIEAMKLMNEIEARVAGRIAKILVENGQPVEYGQPLFLVEPSR